MEHTRRLAKNRTMALWTCDVPALGERPDPCTGHIAAIYGREMIVWGGFTFRDVDDLTAPVHTFNLDERRWRVLKTQGDVPRRRSGAVGLVHRGTLYVFGGWCRASGHTATMLALCLHTGTWSRVEYKGTLRPSPRDKLAGFVYEDRLYYFGGWGPREGVHAHHFEKSAGGLGDLGWNNELWCFDPAQKDWARIETTGIPPSPRAAHTFTLVGASGFVFGGRDRGGRQAGLHCLHVPTATWLGPKGLTTHGHVPCARSWHVATALGPTRLLVQGGLSQGDVGGEGTGLGDAWVYDTQTGTYTALAPCPNPRLWHTACYGPETGTVLFFGGRSSSSGGSVGHSEVSGLRTRVPTLRGLAARHVLAAGVAARSDFGPKDLHALGLPLELIGLLLLALPQARHEHSARWTHRQAAEDGSPQRVMRARHVQGVQCPVS